MTHLKAMPSATSAPTAILTFLLILGLPLAAHANPVIIDGQSAIAFGIVAFWALVIESAVTALILLPTGIAIVPSFVFLTTANIAVFVFAFAPLSDHVSLWILEPAVVLADALCIKILTSTSPLQNPNFIGISWPRALIASLIGNTLSFFVGIICSQSPWYEHDPM